ncbi:hypothetical protein F4804DRAFT_314979 [Jackrogersella minutella]|nr:hypothetical protein F4804DRAFT_314979 [Jackrogersella minutella]
MSAALNKRRLQNGGDRNRGHSSTSSRTQHGDSLASLPAYEPPSCPLNAHAIRELSQLSASKDTRTYEEQLKKSIELLSATVRDINDKYAERKGNLKRHQEKRAENGGEKNDRERAEEQAVLALKNDVPLLTSECDLAVRNVIDLRVELEDGNVALRDMAVKFEDEARRRGARVNDEDDEMAGANFTEPMGFLAQAKAEAAREYASKSLYEKYGANNDYIGFKRLWHDAAHGGDGKPLPDASKWFSQNGGADEEDEDEDLIVSGEQLYIHCPLSMAVMQDPYTSAVCKHTFEKGSIRQFLVSQPGGRARCPQTGCNKEVSFKDFQPDPVRLRLIKRRLAMQQEDEDDDDGGNADADGDSDMVITKGRNIKSEREGRGKGRRVLEEIEGDESEES